MFSGSTYVATCLSMIDLAKGSAVLDMPAGYGRHSLVLAEAGHAVIAADIDADRLAAVADTYDRAALKGTIECVVADGTQALPFKPRTFDLILVVHFVADNLVRHLRPLLREGGHLLFESFGGHGENYKALPQPGEMKQALAGFDILDYRERPIGPTRREAVSVRFLARVR
jgi:SAM-dependent methyltransferase